MAGPRRTQSHPPYSATAAREPSGLGDRDDATRKGTTASGRMLNRAASSGKSAAGSGSGGRRGISPEGANFQSSAPVAASDIRTSGGPDRWNEASGTMY